MSSVANEVERLRALGPQVQRVLEGSLGKHWFYDVKRRREEAGQRFDRRAGHHDPLLLLGAIVHEPELESEFGAREREAAGELLDMLVRGEDDAPRAAALVDSLLGVEGARAPERRQPEPEPVAFAPPVESEPAAFELPVEPEPAAFEPPVAPEPVLAEPEAVADEPEPEPEPVAAEPEPEPEPVAAEPEPVSLIPGMGPERAQLAAQVLQLRDGDGMKWKDIEAQTGLSSSQLRRLYNAAKEHLPAPEPSVPEPAQVDEPLATAPEADEPEPPAAPVLDEAPARPRHDWLAGVPVGGEPHDDDRESEPEAAEDEPEVDVRVEREPMPVLAGADGPAARGERDGDDPPGSAATAVATGEPHGDGPILQATNVSKVFGGLVAVNDVDFAVPRAGIVSLIGPNGAGKTTFFNCMTGLYKPTTGRVVFEGKDITGLRPDLVTNAGVARTFQNIKLFRTMTALENVQVGMHGRLRSRITGMIVRTPFVRREERTARDRAKELLDFVGLRRHDELAMNLPYGDQRRLEIARALASEPRLLLLDEPTAGMNPQESEELRTLMERLRTEQGISVLLIEHDMKVVMNVSDHITVLDHGEKIAEGSPQEVRENPKVIEAYLGSQA